MTPELMHMEGDLEAAEARSADSMDDAVPDTGDITQGTSNLREEKSGSAPPAVDCSSLGEDGSAGGRNLAALRSIKPDSSWIRPVSLDLGSDVGESSTDDFTVAGTSQSLPSTPATAPTGVAVQANAIEGSSSQHQCQSVAKGLAGTSMTLHGVTETESSDTSTQMETDVPWVIRKHQKAVHSFSDGTAPGLITKPTETPMEHTDPTARSDVQNRIEDQASSADAKGDESSVHTSSSTPPKEDLRPKPACPTDKGSTSPKPGEGGGEKPKIEMGVRQYFFREKIPWSPGKVQKMREGINKTGNLIAEDEEDKTDSAGQEMIAESSQGLISFDFMYNWHLLPMSRPN